ncbi:hypothetical protein DXC76_12470, partial [Burkholderiales bacterium]
DSPSNEAGRLKRYFASRGKNFYDNGITTGAESTSSLVVSASNIAVNITIFNNYVVVISLSVIVAPFIVFNKSACHITINLAILNLNIII